MNNEPDYRFDSYCGIHCGSCFVLRGYVDKRDIELLEPWSEWLKGMNLQCHGCKSEDIFENCKGCPRRPCAEERGLEYCFQCNDYPCDIYKSAAEKFHLAHHEVAQEKIKILEENGLHAWLSYQRERWTCSNCGANFTWYEIKCWKCGETVLDSISEEKILFNKR